MNMDGYFTLEYTNKSVKTVKYDLSLSVLENLEDPILVDFLADVMGYTE